MNIQQAERNLNFSIEHSRRLTIAIGRCADTGELSDDDMNEYLELSAMQSLGLLDPELQVAVERQLIG